MSIASFPPRTSSLSAYNTKSHVPYFINLFFVCPSNRRHLQVSVTDKSLFYFTYFIYLYDITYRYEKLTLCCDKVFKIIFNLTVVY